MHLRNILKFAARLFTVFLAISPFSMEVTAHAQTGVVKVDIPFAFESGSAHLAPGVYRFHVSALTPIMHIEGAKSSAYQVIMTDSSMRSSGTGKVIFRRYGSRYILKQVWMAGDTRFVRTPNTKVEKQLEFQQAQANNANEQTDLALLATLR